MARRPLDQFGIELARFDELASEVGWIHTLVTLAM